MTKEILRLVKAPDFHLTDQEHRLLGTHSINIWYGYSNNCRYLSQINSIAQKIHKDFPNMRYSDMEISIIPKTHSIKHGDQVFLKICVPIAHFLDLRKKETFGIL